MKRHLIILVVIILLAVIGGIAYRTYENGTDKRGATKLMRALEEHTSLKQTTRLIQRSENINQRDKEGQTALFYALQYAESPEIVTKLLKAGAGVNIVDKKGYSPLMLAIEQNSSMEMIKELVEAGADVEAKNAEGKSVLLLALQYGSPELLRFILQQRIDTEIINTNRAEVKEILANNTKFTEEEKIDYRQAMLVLSILNGVKKGPLKTVDTK